MEVRDLIGLCCLVFCFAACKKGEGDLCEFDDECKSGLSCYEHTTFDQRQCLTHDAADKMCRESLYCSTFGKCSTAGSVSREICVAKSKDDCAKARTCEGVTCEVVDGRCEIVAP